MKSRNRVLVCPSIQLEEGNYKRVDVIYAKESSSVVVFRLNGICSAYRNLCVHMPRRLDCEKDMIFDDTGKNLRCTMHGIVYDPQSGASVSAICHGEKLTPVRIEEDKHNIWIADNRVKPLLQEFNSS